MEKVRSITKKISKNSHSSNYLMEMKISSDVHKVLKKSLKKKKRSCLDKKYVGHIISSQKEVRYSFLQKLSTS